MKTKPDPDHPLMLTDEVAALFGVTPITVVRWADAGRLTAVRTLGGHRRFQRAEVEALARASGIRP